MSREFVLRSLTVEDLPLVLLWRNNPEVRRYMFSRHLISDDEHLKWYERVSQDDTKRLLLALDASEPIGFVQFNGVARGNVACWGFYNRPNAPKGTGSSLGRAALNYAFFELGLHKVCGQAIDSNKASIALHTKLGFQQEGSLREHQLIDGKYYTLVCFGLLSDEWQKDRIMQVRTDAEN